MLKITEYQINHGHDFGDIESVTVNRDDVITIEPKDVLGSFRWMAGKRVLVFQFTSRGMANVSRNGKVIYIGNHNTYDDTFEIVVTENETSGPLADSFGFADQTVFAVEDVLVAIGTDWHTHEVIRVYCDTEFAHDLFRDVSAFLSMVKPSDALRLAMRAMCARKERSI